MMVGERQGFSPSWVMVEEDSGMSGYPLSPSSIEQPQFYLQEALKALQRYLPCAKDDENHMAEDHHPDSPVDAFSSDQFRMYEFKVRRCARGRSHDWTECPFAHPGEKARRRDPRRFHYSGTACPEFRKGGCKKGDSCEYSHGVFECWLHPARYRTQPCKDGINCRRRVCFFAHTPDQLRVLPGNQSPASPPTSPPAFDSPPRSPIINRTLNDVVSSLVNIQLGKVGSYPPLWGVGSPRSYVGRSSYLSLPTTPTREGIWDKACFEEEGEMMQRVESGREIRKRMLEKLSKENSFKTNDPKADAGSGPDVEWVSDLLN